MSGAEEAVVVLVAVPGPEAARAIAGRLIEERLAACVQTHPITSRFRWEGRVEEAQEVMMTIKTVRGRYRAIEERVRSLHEYEVPEIVCLPVLEGWGPYLDWLRAETGNAAN